MPAPLLPASARLFSVVEGGEVDALL